MRFRNTISLPVLKSLCSYYSALGHVRGFPEAGKTKGQTEPRVRAAGGPPVST